mmetsp:Transcript_26860/g.61943  ORF Transcript_26860/g.61943 Transcript_26860/m.61943 type:complete len:241 (+) Transcript_26860:98-820(+)
MAGVAATFARTFGNVPWLNSARRKVRQHIDELNSRCRKHPFLTSGVGASVFLSCTDVISQRFTTDETWDSRRTLAFAAWGLIWYGGPQQLMWTRVYPYFFPSKAWKHVSAKAFTDAVPWMGFSYLPCFYIFTGAIKGQSLEQSVSLLQREFLGAWMGCCPWFPAQLMNFRFVPIYLQTFVVQACNIVHKSWLSWLSNRERVAERAVKSGVQPVCSGYQDVQETALKIAAASLEHVQPTVL